METKVRVQPRNIRVRKDDPFRDDGLGREESATILTSIVSSIEGPCVLAIDAPWGEGKSTFINMWTGHLQREDFFVVNFSAWETDFATEPFIALSEELSQDLEQYMTRSAKLAAAMGKVGRAAKAMVKRALPTVVSIGTQGVLDVKPFMEEFSEERMSGYREARKAMREFRDSLEEMATSLAESNEGRPLIVIIDELERCRPTYGVKLLEVAKHLFAVDHIVFVLAVNRLEFEHSIRGLYGSEFDAQGYLRRFFDIDFHLSQPDQGGFIESNLRTTGINGFFDNSDMETRERYPVIKEMILSFFSAYNISLRTTSQSLHRLGLTLASLPDNQRPLGFELVVALILRTVDIGLYHRFLRREATDEQVVESIFGRPGAEAIREKPEGMLFEVILILGMMHLVPGDNYSSLMERYERLLGEPDEDNAQDSERARASKIVEEVKAGSPSLMDGRPSKFGDAVERLELVSRDFIREESEEV